jgi:hypothetical protein
MSNPLLERANASIAFTQPAPGTYTDNLGNVCPNASIVTLQAFLKVKQGKTSIDTNTYPGIDLAARELSGYTCSGPLPLTVPTMAWYKATFGKDSGWFYLKQHGRYGGTGIDLMIESVLDTYIEGFFQLHRTSL